MHQVVTPLEMRAIEERALQAGISQEELMERAGRAVANIAASMSEKKMPILVICGKGNNGGDGYVAARELLNRSFHVSLWQLPHNATSPLLTLQRKRFEEAGGKVALYQGQDIPKDTFIVDALFGIGFQGNVEGLFFDVIEKINHSSCPVVSIDIPSGLDGETGLVSTIAVMATAVAAIEFPKLGFYIGDGWNFCGSIHPIPIDLSPYAAARQFECIERSDLKPLLPPIIRNRHKYESGHVVGIAGSKGMMGAACLAAFSALKTGCGICHLLHPESASSDAVKCPLEVITLPYGQNSIQDVKNWLQHADACFIGPGMGRSEEAGRFLQSIWSDITISCVVDADALYWLSKNVQFCLGPHCVLTPHINEMRRLLDIASDGASKKTLDLPFLNSCLAFTKKNRTHVVLKGGPTFLFSPDGPIAIMPFGDPGMATAGSGDVLTGMIASLMAQGLKPHEAMVLGTSIHGISGIKAQEEETSYCITATSLIEHLPQAFTSILA